MAVKSTGPAPGRTATVTVIALAIAALLILIGSFALPFGSPAAALLFDHQPYSIFPFPLTIQNMTYMIFAAGMADLFVRCRGGISHHPDEHVEPADADAGARVLLRLIENFRPSS